MGYFELLIMHYYEAGETIKYEIFEIVIRLSPLNVPYVYDAIVIKNNLNTTVLLSIEK